MKAGFTMLFFLTFAVSLTGQNNPNQMTKDFQEATFGAGCFWCVEAIFQDLKGVISVESGYAGGKIKDPTYKEICSGLTGHAEVIRIKFNPTIITYADLVRVLMVVHDPTTLNRQGNDVGSQYRSVVFFHSKEQKEVAERIKKEFNLKKIYDSPIVTAIEPLTNYYPAEQYHQNYYKDNPNQGYCKAVIAPKILKFRKHYQNLLKKQ